MTKSYLTAIITSIMVVFVLIGDIHSRDRSNLSQPSSSPALLQLPPTQTLLNVNNMASWIRNDGWSARNPYTGNSGTWFPRATGTDIYQDGIIWGAIVRDVRQPALPKMRVGGQTYRIGTIPGHIISAGTPSTPPVASDPNNARIYRIRRDWQSLAIGQPRLIQDAAELFFVPPASVTPQMQQEVIDWYAYDWANWPANLGAPYYDINGNGSWDPGVDEPGLANADQVIWFVMNDTDDGACLNLYGAYSIGLEIQVTQWSYDIPGSELYDGGFSRYRIINKSGFQLDSMFLAQWVDPDIGDANNDFVGCDELVELGYGYNGEPQDPVFASFGLNPPAFGYLLLQGPVVPSPGDTALFNFAPLPDYRNLEITSFGYFGAGMSITDPDLGEYNGTIQWYNLLNGYLPIEDSTVQSPYLHGAGPNAGQPTKFPLNGDPFAMTGDIDGQGSNLPIGDRRLNICTGPFYMQPGDTQEIVLAKLGGYGITHRQAVSELRNKAAFIKQSYPGIKSIARSLTVSFPSGSQNTIIINANLNDFSGVQTVWANFFPEVGTEPGLSVELYDDGQHNDSLAGDGIWGNQSTQDNRQYPYRGDLEIHTSQGLEYYSGIFQNLQLRPSPELRDFRVIWENGLQDSSVNNHEKVFLDVVVDNKDLLNPVQQMMLSNENYQSSSAVIIPAGTSLRPDSLLALIYGPAQGDTVSFSLLIEFDYHILQETYQLPVQQWSPPSNWGDTLEVISVVGVIDQIFPIVVDPGMLTGHNYELSFYNTNEMRWRLRDLTIGQLKYENGLPTNDPNYLHPIVDGIQYIVRAANQDFANFIVISNAAGVLDPPEQGCFAFNNSGFPLFMGSDRPDPARQQTNGSAWGVHTGMVSGNDGSFAFFKARVARNDNWDRIIPYDFEMRFTPAGGQAQMIFTSGSIINVPFELWNIGIGTPSNNTDDYRMIPWIFDEGEDDIYNFATDPLSGQGVDHVISGGSNDPYLDWVYFLNPTDTSPGDAGYQAVVNSGWTTGIEDEVIARLVLVNWNGGEVLDPTFPANVNAQMPETGTTWQILTSKPNQPGDTLLIQTPTGIADNSQLPLRYDLFQNYPNPFNPVTTIRFSLVKAQPVKLEIFNILGQKVKTLVDWRMNAGGHEITWNSLNDAGRAVASGIYLYRITAGDFVQTRKMILFK